MRVAHLFRHPIKSHGAEEVGETTLTPGEAMPWDRHWALSEEGADVTDGEWASCRNFSRAAKSPALMAISCERHDDGTLTLRHPDRPALSFDPAEGGDMLRDWATPLVAEGRPAPDRLIEVGARGMTDSPFPSLSILGLSSLRALSQKVGQTLSPLRFRGNVWLDDTGPWEEFEWIGRRLQIGDATLEVAERIARCRATEANPDTGRRDAGTLTALRDGWGHTDFGVYAFVVKGGRIAAGDAVTVL
ncbi:MAG: MOSC domain-containing protein [Shimia sp.]